jgi:hypothetical protein
MTITSSGTIEISIASPILLTTDDILASPTSTMLVNDTANLGRK